MLIRLETNDFNLLKSFKKIKLYLISISQDLLNQRDDRHKRLMKL